MQPTAFTTESSGSVAEIKSTAEGMSKGGFSLQGIVALPCASQSTDTLAKHTYIAINTTSSSSLIQEQEYEGKTAL